jgi:hypothetical protein
MSDGRSGLPETKFGRILRDHLACAPNTIADRNVMGTTDRAWLAAVARTTALRGWDGRELLARETDVPVAFRVHRHANQVGDG